jgi:hypothetical protein
MQNLTTRSSVGPGAAPVVAVYLVPDHQRQLLLPSIKLMRDTATALRNGTKHSTSLKRLLPQHAAVCQQSEKATALLGHAHEPLDEARRDTDSMIAACNGAREATVALSSAAQLASQLVRDLRL